MVSSRLLEVSSTGFGEAERVDMTTFRQVEDLAAGIEFLVVVKSQDQEERRRRMLKSLKTGSIGRVSERPVAEGLFLRGSFQAGVFTASVDRAFREPRHIVAHGDGGFLLTEINKLLHIDQNGRTLREYTYPYFSYLHSVSLSSDGSSALLASSGYDSLVELDLASGDINWHWFAWEHGFNPDEEGVWLAATPERQRAYEAEGKRSMVIHPDAFGEQGLLVARRSAHPNCAVFDGEGDETVLCSIGAHGEIYRITRETGAAKKLIDWLSPMPHGLKAHNGQWIVTNTTKGEFWVLDQSFAPVQCYVFSSLGGKLEGCGDSEWLQQVIPISASRYIAIDSNRSIFCFDLDDRVYTAYQIDRNYCVQDILPLV